MTTADTWGTGVLYEVENPCNPNPCLNGGNCKIENGNSTCYCQPGFTGEWCENSKGIILFILLCTPIFICLNGILLKHILYPMLGLCTPDYCNYNGNCKIENGEAKCECYPGFVGDNCDAGKLCTSDNIF